MTDAAYLDWNATAPLRPEVIAAVSEALAHCGNPSSVHRWGRARRQVVERARAAVATLVGARADGVVFTSGGSEANHLALRGVPHQSLLVSAIEHDSVRAASDGAVPIPVRSTGVVDLDALARLIAAARPPALVSLMLANNETGVIQPVAEAAAITHRHGGLVHCDGIQAAGKIPVSLEALGADLLSVSAHKIGGPQGVGALVVRDDLSLTPMLRGGGQERGRRAGTENVPCIVGFGIAAKLALDCRHDQISEMRDEAQARLMELAPDARVFGVEASRLPNTLCISMPGVPAATQVMALDLAGIMVSAGAACSSGKVRQSHVLAAMGATPDEAQSAIRISIGRSTEPREIDRLVDTWGALYRRTRAEAA